MRTDGRTDRYDEATSHFSQFFEKRLKSLHPSFVYSYISVEREIENVFSRHFDKKLFYYIRLSTNMKTHSLQIQTESYDYWTVHYFTS